MNLKATKNAALGVIREVSGGGLGNSFIQRVGSASNRMVLNSSKNGILFKHTAARMSNGFTGLGLTALGTAAIVGGLGVKGAVDTYNMIDQIDKAGRPPAEDIGHLSTMSSDAVGSINKGQRTLGATGELVFGLHAMDKRGRGY